MRAGLGYGSFEVASFLGEPTVFVVAGSKDTRDGGEVWTWLGDGVRVLAATSVFTYLD